MLSTALGLSWRRLWVFCFLGVIVPHAAWARVHSRSPARQNEPTELTYVGYIDDAHSPQVHVQTSEKTQARLERLASDHWVLHVPHAEIVRHVFSLPLDTSCFSGPIERIEPEAQEEPDNGTVVNIRLRKHAILRLTQHDRNILIDVVATRRKAVTGGQKRPHE